MPIHRDSAFAWAVGNGFLLTQVSGYRSVKIEIKHPGNDATVITYGRGVTESLNAAKSLESEGISVEVLDLRTLVPFDLAAMVAVGGAD